MKLIPFLLLAFAFLTGCSTLDMKVINNADGSPISDATIVVQYINISNQSKDLDHVGTVTTDAQGRASLETVFRKAADLQLTITRQNHQYQTVLIWNNISQWSQTAIGIQSIKADQKVPDPSTPTINLKYRWHNSDAPDL